jgi:hypothetical protein
MTAAVRLLVRVAIRNQWRKLALLAIVTAVSCGFVLTAVTGARRSDTAWSRLLDHTKADVALVNVDVEQTDAVRASLLRRDDVAAAGAFNWMPAAPPGVGDEVGLFAGVGPGFGTTVYEPLITRGRLPHPSRADEVTINAELAKLAHLKVGDRTHFVGPGIDQPATIVGIHRSSLDIGSNGGAPSAQGTPAFMVRWLAGVRELFGPGLRPAIAVRFRSGVDVDAALRSITHQHPDASVVPPAVLNSDAEKGFGAATMAYLVLAGACAIATLVLLTLLGSRLLRASGADPAILSALGTTRRDRTVAAWAPIAAALIAGLVLAQLLSVVASPLVRTGIVKLADPVAGVWTDVLVLVAAAGALAVALLAAALLAAMNATSTRQARDIALRPATVARFARSSPAALVGLCGAVGGMSATARRVTRSSLIGVMLAGTFGVGALVWHASLDRLTETPRLHGWDFDLYAYAGPEGKPADLAEARTTLLGNPDVRGLTRYARFQLAVDGTDLDVFGLIHERGAVHPTMRRGRAPNTVDEVTLGPTTMRRLNVDVGDTFSVLASDGRKVRLTVVGEATFPLIGNAAFGDTFSTTMDTLRHLGAQTNEEGFLIDLRPGARAAAVEHALGDAVVVRRPFLPPPIIRLRDARGIEFALVAFFAAFLAVVFAFGLATTTARQRREYAIVRVIGMNRQQVMASFGWQAVSTMAAAAIVAATLGSAVGRVAWRLSSKNLGVLDSFALPVRELGIAVLGAAVLALVVAGLTAIRPALGSVGSALRSE